MPFRYFKKDIELNLYSFLVTPYKKISDFLVWVAVAPQNGDQCYRRAEVLTEIEGLAATIAQLS